MLKRIAIGLVLSCLLGLPLWPAQAPAQGGLWETYTAAGDKAYHKGNYPEAEKQWVAAFTEAEGFEPQDPRLATSLNNLGEVYRLQRRYAAAEPQHKRALAIREKVLDSEHPDVAQSLENYAALLRKTGRGNEAAWMETRAKAIRTKHAEQNPTK